MIVASSQTYEPRWLGYHQKYGGNLKIYFGLEMAALLKMISIQVIMYVKPVSWQKRKVVWSARWKANDASDKQENPK